MSKRRLPDLPETGRRYLDQTMRARLASPGIQRYGRRRGATGRVLVAALVAAALVATMLWLR